MTRVWHIWSVFGLCLVLVLGAMGWVSHVALDLDRNEAAAREQAAREENVRLALWRMDSALWPLIAQESGRPYFAYGAFYPAERAYTKMFSEIGKGEVLVPSPLLTFESPYVRLHFQYVIDSELTSPQAPAGNQRDLAEGMYTTFEKVQAGCSMLEDLSRKLDTAALAAALPEPAEPVVTLPLTSTFPPGPSMAQPQQQESLPWNYRGQQDEQQKLSSMEAKQRQQSAQSAYSNSSAWNSSLANKAAPEGLREGAMEARWIGKELVLARRVVVDGKPYVQGCWLEWPAIERWMLESVRELLPAARLKPCAREDQGQETRRLATLPVRLIPGEIPFSSDRPWSPIRWALLVAWGCGALAVLAVGALIWGAVSLSERRGAFVSAVTHELRTPLTTFRMYAEMLAEGMVRDEAKRKDYLNTLRAESERLGHLVENVLAYAGLERGRFGTQRETLGAASLVERLSERLAARAGQAGMTFRVETDPPAADAAVHVDPGGVERILFNLVDNACKYGQGAEHQIVLQTSAANGQVLMRVTDGGPGIPERETRKLFRPFSKSAREAAHSAPGVGLGLALSRKLARSMGGDLRYLSQPGKGATFELALPAAARCNPGN